MYSFLDLYQSDTHIINKFTQQMNFFRTLAHNAMQHKTEGTTSYYYGQMKTRVSLCNI